MQEWYSKHQTMVVLGVHDKDDLWKWQTELFNFKCSAFTEPDMDNELTALVVEPSAGKLLKNLRLL